ncbi:MAG: class I SAM-dependent methyltransferase [Rudaea sp.]
MKTSHTGPDVVRCPVCSHASDHLQQVPGWGAWRRCPNCTLEFADPLHLGQDPRSLFDNAYRGRVQVSGMTDFHKRVEQRRVILKELDDPSLWFWTPAFKSVLDWLRRSVKPGSTVLELGCGLGFFLHALKREGYEAVGLDVAETAVDLNRRDGFDVWHGPVESMPHGWTDPQAVVSFFMLHHLENPMGFLCALRERAPRAPLAIAVYGPSNKGGPASLPPRTLIRWNGRALATALELSGYQVDIQEIESTGAESDFLEPIRSTLARSMALPSLYRLGKRMEARVLARTPARLRHEAYVVLALAKPVPAAAGA